MYSETEPYENLIEVLIDFTDRGVDLRFRLLVTRKDRKEARALRNSMIRYFSEGARLPQRLLSSSPLCLLSAFAAN